MQLLFGMMQDTLRENRDKLWIYESKGRAMKT